MIAIENVLERVAHQLHLPPHVVRERNMYRIGNTMPSSAPILDDTLWKCWERAKAITAFETAANGVLAFNEANRWRKRGIALVPHKCNVGFELDMLNQAGALVHIYRDGSVLVHHGGKYFLGRGRGYRRKRKREEEDGEEDGEEDVEEGGGGRRRRKKEQRRM